MPKLKPSDKRLKKNRSKRNTLTKAQREATLSWLAEGCYNEEIRNRAKEFKPPFTVSDQHIYQLRRTSKEILSILRKENDELAVTRGAALRAKRLEKLIRLSNDMERDLFEKKLMWVEDKKMVGEDEYDFYKYNQAQVDQYRKVLDDIAKEVGGRINRTDITSDEKPIKGYVGISPDDWDKE